MNITNWDLSRGFLSGSWTLEQTNERERCIEFLNSLTAEQYKLVQFAIEAAEDRRSQDDYWPLA
jgi:hypothetical protein